VSAGDRIRVHRLLRSGCRPRWMEIHPVSRITVIGYQPVSAPSPRNRAHARGPGRCYPRPAAATAMSQASSALRGAGETGVAGDSKTITCTDVNGYRRWRTMPSSWAHLSRSGTSGTGRVHFLIGMHAIPDSPDRRTRGAAWTAAADSVGEHWRAPTLPSVRLRPENPLPTDDSGHA